MKSKKNLGLLLGLFIILALVVTGCSGTTTPAPVAAPVVKEVPKTVPIISLVDQVKNTQHYKMFPVSIAEIEKDSKFDYGDGCIKCHSQVAILNDKDAKMADFFKGGKYATQKEGVTCLVCHNVSGTDMFTLRNQGWDTCTVCHTADKPVLKVGSEVHHPTLEMVSGIQVGEGKPPIPSYKYKTMKDTFSCVDCHITDAQNHTFMVPGVTATYDALGTTRTGTKMDWDKFATVFKQPKCITCHADPKPVMDKIKAQSDEINTKIEALRPIYTEWSKKVDTLAKDDPKLAAFNVLKTNFWYVDADASKGVHNYELAKVLIQDAEAAAAKLK